MARRFRIQFAGAPFQPGYYLKQIKEVMPDGTFIVNQSATNLRGRRRYGLRSRRRPR